MARAFAPALWFAADEPAYPTLPHPFAFDGLDTQTVAPPGTPPVWTAKGDATFDCSITTAAGGEGADLADPRELLIDQRCDLGQLIRRFRPLSAEAAAATDAKEAAALPRPPMRVMFYGPELFSGGLALRDEDLKGTAGLCKQAETKGFPISESLQRFAAGHWLTLPPQVDVRVRDWREGLETCDLDITYKDLRRQDRGHEVTSTARLRWVVEDVCRADTWVFPGKEERPKWCGKEYRASRARRLRKDQQWLFVGPKSNDTEEGVVQPPRYVIQYWFYYLYDRGTHPHTHDLEHLFVFLDGDPRSRHELTAESRVAAIVGAGHEEDTANNILVAGRMDAREGNVRESLFPEELPRHMVTLVELGKHASAPDRGADGRFDPGMDANLWSANAWGSRDSQNALFAKVQLGAFDAWNSFPRSMDTLWTEGVQPGESAGAGSYWAGYAESAQQRLKQAEGAKSSRARGGQRRFELFPIEDMRRLYAEIEKSPPGQTSTVQEFLDNHRRCFWGEAAPGLDQAQWTVTADTLTAMRTWLCPLNEKRDVWIKDAFLRPNAVFKEVLFPRVSLGLSSKLIAGNRLDGIAVQASDITDARLLHDSTLEIAYYPRDDGWRSLGDLALTVENFRGRYRGWYVGGAWSKQESARSAWFYRLGYAVELPSLAKLKFLGPEASNWKAALRFGGRGLVWGGGPSASGGADGRPRGIRFEATLNLTRRVIRSKHPLCFFPSGITPKANNSTESGEAQQ